MVRVKNLQQKRALESINVDNQRLRENLETAARYILIEYSLYGVPLDGNETALSESVEKVEKIITFC